MVKSTACALIRIPKVFFDDHRDRGLDCPYIYRYTKRHYWIDPDDRHTAELADDALYYSHDVDACERGLIASARATLKAIRDMAPA